MFIAYEIQKLPIRYRNKKTLWLFGVWFKPRANHRAEPVLLSNQVSGAIQNLMRSVVQLS